MKIGWGAVRTLARLEIRRRWRGLLVLALAAGIFAGTALAVAGALWRTDSAYDRLVRATKLDDLRISSMAPAINPGAGATIAARQAVLISELERSPGVTATQQLSVQVGRIAGGGVRYASVYASRAPLARVGVPVVIDGRAPATSSPVEVMLEETRASEAHLQVGDVVPMDLLTAAQFQRFSTGVGEPAGGHVDLRVVGIFRYPQPRFGFDSFLASPAFYRAHLRNAAGVLTLFATAGHRPVPSIITRVQAADEQFRAEFGPSQTPYLTIDEPRRSPDPSIAPTRAVLQSGLLALTLVVAGAGVLLAGQLAGRWAERGRSSQEIENALGLRAIERALARVLAALPAVLVVAALAVTGALVGGLIEPLGALDRFEPSPGWLARPLIVAGGALVVVALMLLLLAWTSLRAGRPRRLPARRRRRHVGPVRLRAPVLLARALTSGRGGTGTTVPARSMVIGLAAMLAALVVVGEVHAQLGGLQDERARWGWIADFGVADDTPGLDASLALDPRVRDLDQITDAPVRLRARDGDTRTVFGYGHAALTGHLPYTTGTGRLPAAIDEVALGPRLLHELDLQLGDTLVFDVPASVRTARVVGTVLLPSVSGENLGEDILFTTDGLRRVATNAGYSSLLVRAADAAAATSLQQDLSREWELIDPTPPASVAAIDELTVPTRVLLLILLLAAVLLIAQNARLLLRRRGSQLAIVDAMGMSRGRLILAASSSLLASALLAVLLGVPFGWAVSRIVLHEIAPRLGLLLGGPGVLAALGAGAVVLALAALVALASTAVALRPHRRFALAIDG